MRPYLVTLALVGLALVAFSPVLWNGFVDFDDDLYVTENRWVLGGINGAGLGWAWTTLHAGYWQPLTWMSLQLDAQLYGSHAAGFHLTNYLLHAANVVLLFVLLLRLTGATWRSAAVAALFAVHPLHVESVAWVTERKDVLSTLFGLLTLLAYQSYAARPGLARYGLVFVGLTLGLLAKPMLVTLPLVLLLLDYWPLRRWQPIVIKADTGALVPPGTPVSLPWLLAEKLPLLALAVAFSAITIIAQEKVGALVTLQRLPVEIRLGNAVLAYEWYLDRTFWPIGLAPFYPHPGSQLAWWRVSVAAGMLGILTALAVRTARRRPYFLVGWLWFLGTLVPVLGLVQAGEQPWADRFTYWPHVGLFLVLAWGLGELWARWHISPAVGAVGAAILLTAAATATWFQARLWLDSVVLLEHTLQVTTANPVAHNTLAAALMRRGQTEEAIGHLHQALRLEPDFAKAHFNLGVALAQKGRMDDAVLCYQKTLRVDPGFAPAAYNLGVVLAQQGRTREAIPHFVECLRLDRDFAPAHFNLGIALVDTGEYQKGAVHFAQAMRLDPAFEKKHQQVGFLYLAHGQSAAAVEHYRAALRRDPSAGVLHYHLGRALADLGRWEEAETCFRRAVILTPASPHARCGLAWVLQNQGSSAAAKAEYREAFRLDPQWPQNAVAQAWTMATHSDSRFRNGLWALALAQQACQGTKNEDPHFLDVQAAAFAEVGKFGHAVTTGQRAQERAAAEKKTTLSKEIEARLRLYQKRQPFRSKGPVGIPPG